jgi:two-component system sensor histidine kinase EvgS
MNSKYFQSVFESANVGKSITLPSGEIFVNKAFCDLLGYSKEELQNTKWQDITPKEENEKINELLSPLFEGKKDAIRFEKRYIHKNGSFVWADVSIALKKDTRNIPEYLITTVVDISRQKMAEGAIEESEKR